MSEHLERWRCPNDGQWCQSQLRCKPICYFMRKAASMTIPDTAVVRRCGICRGVGSHGEPPIHCRWCKGTGKAVSTPQRQIEILRHALGTGDKGRGRSYRNHFVTGPGSDDYDDCEALVAAGMMSRHQGNSLSGGDPIFTVTEQGKVVAKEQKL